MTYQELIKKYSALATKEGLEVESIKFLVLESCESPTQFYLQLNQSINPENLEKITKALDLYVTKKVPVQHILGYAYFYGNRLTVNNQVLIPRRETEELVENILIYYDEFFQDTNVDVVDLGTGSGAIAITLASEEALMKVYASDISSEALAVAESNAKLLGVDIDFRVSNWLEQFSNKFDIIVANPPYIPINETVGLTVEKEPNLALYGGDNGLIHYETILQQSLNHIKSKALIGFEHGIWHNEQLNKIIKKYYPTAKIIHKKDLQGLDRFTFIGINIDIN